MDDSFYFQLLREKIATCFDLQDLRTLCFDLDIVYDELSGDRLSAKVVSLILYMRKASRMENLIQSLKMARPEFEWPEWNHHKEPTTKPVSYTLATFSTPENPFGPTGRIQKLENYLVRQPFTEAVINELKKGTSLSITGPSQTGKSSLLWYIAQHGPEQLKRPSEDFLYLSMELIHNEDEFFDFICSELDIQTARGFRLARKLKGRKIILCLDEIEKMTWNGFSLNIRTELRGLADGANAPITLVIASRTPLNQLFPDSPEMTSPLAGLCVQLKIPFFTQAEAHALVAHYLKENDIVMPENEVEKVWQQTQGHPHHLQLGLKQLFNHINTKG